MTELFVSICRSNNFLGRMFIDFDNEKLEIVAVQCDFNAGSELVEKARKKVKSLVLFSYSLLILVGYSFASFN